jgi:hypothetical protein
VKINPDYSDIIIKNNQDDINNRHYLLICERGVVHDYIETRLDNKPLKIHIPLEMYPKGIVQLTLYDSLFRPLAERWYSITGPIRRFSPAHNWATFGRTSASFFSSPDP